MIYRIANKKSDKVLLARSSGKHDSRKVHNQNYADVIVKKPWGYEYLVFENGQTAIWLLHVARKQRTSMHAHLNKATSLVLFSGAAVCHHLDGEIKLRELDGIKIDKGAFHSTEAYSDLAITPQSENGVWVMEIESPVDKSDLVRVKDEYGRQGASYEGVDNMVFDVKQCLKLKTPRTKDIFKRKSFNCNLTMVSGAALKSMKISDKDALIAVVGNTGKESNNHCLRLGAFCKWDDFHNKTKHLDLKNYTLLIMEKETMLVKLSDYVFTFIAGLGVKEVFAVCGGAAMHLVDSAGKTPDLKYIAVQHEQAGAMAAEAWARIAAKPGACLVTSGPGGTNTLTGVCGAWIDSIPVMFVSGQVTSDTLIKDTGLRQFGIQESDIVSLVKPVTKYALTVTDAKTIKYHLQKAAYLMLNGRPGPVWVDIPLDIQSKMINVEELKGFNSKELTINKSKKSLGLQVAACIKMIEKAERPVLISGYGIRLAHAENEYRSLVKKLKMPVVSSWTSSDLLPTYDDIYVGRSGIMGDRAGNFAVQNSDLLLIIGSRMSTPQVGYNYSTFAREAKRIMVDIDEAELKKPSIDPDLAIQADAGDFINEFLFQIEAKKQRLNIDNWRERCRKWKFKYPVVLPKYKDLKDRINSFYFVDVLAQKLSNDAVVVTDMGTSFSCTMQTFKIKLGQRLFTSSGHASMGFGLPGAIGACFAHGKKKTICISGDGGLALNIQELQTLVHYKLPIILFVLNNQGYLTIKLMQQNHFGRYVGSDPSSGLSCVNIIKVAKAYGIDSLRLSNNQQLHEQIDKVLAQPGPYICEIMMPEDQPLIPRVSSLKKPNGTIISKPLEDLYPFLTREEFLKNMIVKPKEILKD